MLISIVYLFNTNAFAGNVFEDIANVITVGGYHAAVKRGREKAKAEKAKAERKAAEEAKKDQIKHFKQNLKREQELLESALNEFEKLNRILTLQDLIIEKVDLEFENKSRMAKNIDEAIAESYEQMELFQELASTVPLFASQGNSKEYEVSILRPIEQWEASLEALAKISESHQSSIENYLNHALKDADEDALMFLVESTRKSKVLLLNLMIEKEAFITTIAINYNAYLKQLKSLGVHKKTKLIKTNSVDEIETSLRSE